MAERKVTGKSVMLFIDPAGGTAYSLVICLTSNSLKRATTIIDAASKCGPDSQPGLQQISIDLAGQVMVSPAVGRISEADLHDLWVASTPLVGK